MAKRQPILVKELPDTTPLVVVDRHRGRHGSTGGEYGYGRDIYPVRDRAGRLTGVVVAYWTTAEFEYCPHRGVFGPCDEWCRYEVLHPEELEHDVLEALNNNLGYVDATGHRPVYCLYDGGCIECYPCNHPPCWGDGWNEGEEE